MRESEHAPLISAIVPVYRVERYLDRCVGKELIAMDENKTIELTGDGLGGIGGGVGKPKQNPGKRKVSCSNCGTENELPMLISPAVKYTCSKCGAELEL